MANLSQTNIQGNLFSNQGTGGLFQQQQQTINQQAGVQQTGAIQGGIQQGANLQLGNLQPGNQQGGTQQTTNQQVSFQQNPNQQLGQQSVGIQQGGINQQQNFSQQGGIVQGGAQQGQQPQVQQSNQSLNQPQLRFDQVVEKGRRETTKQLENLIKTAEIKDIIDKNHEIIRQIDKNSIYPQQALSAIQQQPNMIGGVQNRTQEQLRAQQQYQDQLKNSVYTGKTILQYKRYSESGLLNLQRNQKETLQSLTDLRNELQKRLDTYDCMHEEERETVCHQLGSLQDAADKVSMNLNDVIQMQSQIMVSMEDEGDNWEHSYKALYSCIMHLQDDINETDEILLGLETHPKIRSR